MVGVADRLCAVCGTPFRRKSVYCSEKCSAKVANARWYAANRDYARDRLRAWQRANKDKAAAAQRRWMDRNPDMWAAVRCARAANRRAKESGASGRICGAAVMALWERQPTCIRCGEGRGLDHIIEYWQGGQNTTDNLENLCRDCNAQKTAELRFKLSTAGHEQYAKARAARATAVAAD